MKIIVVNVNTTKSMTGDIAEAAGRYASPGTAVVALRPYFGAEAVDCNFESYLSAVAVICLGCAGMAGLEEAITIELGVPVIDGIGAAVRLAEAVVGLGLKTSKISTYAPPNAKKITGWPLWQALGVPGAPRRSDAARAALRSRRNDDPRR
jgi:Asp/Glu/hydantoin racemase